MNSRFTIPQRATSASLVIPLHVLPFTGKSGKSAGYKVGINVALSDPRTGASSGPILFEFDTGGKGFYASIPKGVQFPIPSTKYGAVENQYDSGIVYTGQAVAIGVSFPEASSQTFPVIAGFIEHVSDDKPGKSEKFPIYGNFYGDFGASLQASGIDSSNTFSLLTVLAQLGPQYGNGFIVDVGAYPPSGNGSLIAGLTPELRQLFPVTIPMKSAGSYSPKGQSVPAQSIPTFSATLVSGTLQIGTNAALPNIPIILDTGAPHTTIHPGSELRHHDAPSAGETVTLTVAAANGQNVTLLDFAAGHTPGVNEVHVGKAAGSVDPQGYINTGLAPFFSNPIAFDLEQGVLRFPGAQG